MSEDDKIQIAISRGARAKALIEDDLLRECLATMELTYIEKWRTTSVGQTEARERLWQAVNIVGLIRDHLRYVLDNGKIAQAELNKMVAEEKAKR
jgi:hypothetical protein